MMKGICFKKLIWYFIGDCKDACIDQCFSGQTKISGDKVQSHSHLSSQMISAKF